MDIFFLNPMADMGRGGFLITVLRDSHDGDTYIRIPTSCWVKIFLSKIFDLKKWTPLYSKFLLDSLHGRY
jgi:hypothetical protein